MPRVYEGNEPYIFISYAHKDDARVMPIIEALDEAGYRVWYDDGIEWSSEWPKNIADHLYSCSHCLIFMSREAALSGNCGDEIHYAIEHRKQILVAYIEDVDLDKLNRGLMLRLSKWQAKFRRDFDSDEAFAADLLKSRILEPCLTDDAVRRRDARRDAVNLARDALAMYPSDEGQLRFAIDALGRLPRPDGEVDELVARLERRLTDAEAAREAREREERRRAEEAERERKEREERRKREAEEAELRLRNQEEQRRKQAEEQRAARERAIRQAEKVLADDNASEEVMRSALMDLRALPGGDEDVERLASRLEARLAEEKKTRKPAAGPVLFAGIAMVLVVVIVAFALGGNLPKPDSDGNVVSKTEETTATTAETNETQSGKAVTIGDDAESNSADQSESTKNSSSSASKTTGIASYDWSELKSISREIADAGSDEEGLEIAKSYGLVDEDGRLQGDTKGLTLTDGTRAEVRILGFRHDELADGGKAGITFEFADIPKRHAMNAENTNDGGWEASDMREWLNSDFLELLPDDIRPFVATATKYTNNSDKSTSADDKSASDTPDQLWLLSLNEVYGETGVYGEEGTQYQLYADQGVSDTHYDFCKKDGADSVWWLRSPSALDSVWFHSVCSDGDWDAYLAGYDGGVSPGFCF